MLPSLPDQTLTEYVGPTLSLRGDHARWEKQGGLPYMQQRTQCVGGRCYPNACPTYRVHSGTRLAKSAQSTCRKHPRRADSALLRSRPPQRTRHVGQGARHARMSLSVNRTCWVRVYVRRASSVSSPTDLSCGTDLQKARPQTNRKKIDPISGSSSVVPQ